MPVTLTEIAARAGVSQPVVSTVLNCVKGRSRVSAATRRRIHDVARRMGYAPNLSAQILRGKSSKAIGIYSGALQIATAATRQNLLTARAAAAGYQVFMDILPQRDDYETLRKRVLGLLSRRLDGLILLSQLPDDLRRLIDMPSVALSAPFGECPVEYPDIAHDQAVGGHMAGKHLLGHGHRRAVFLCSRLASNRPKFDGLRRAWEEAGFSPEACAVVAAIDSDDRAVGVAESASPQVEADLLRRVKTGGATCILASNDYVAARAMLFLRRSGVRVPEDVALIGFDGAPFAYLTDPPLTTIIQNFELEADMAIALLLERIASGNGNSHPAAPVAVSPLFFAGATCGCPAPSVPLLAWTDDLLTLNERFPHRISDNVPEAISAPSQYI